MRSHELCASAASDKHTSDANGKGGWSGMGGRKMDLLLIFSFFRMNSRQNSSRSNAWKSTDSPFHAGRATAGLLGRAMLWSFETGPEERVWCLLNLEHTYEFSLWKTHSFPLKFTSGIIPERNQRANKIRVPLTKKTVLSNFHTAEKLRITHYRV